MEKISKYLEDKQFIHYVFNPSPKAEEWFRSIEIDNPDEKENIQLARKILLKLQTTDKELFSDEKVILFTRVIKKIEENQKNRKIRHVFIELMKYAAVAILFFALGTVMFYRKKDASLQYFTRDIYEAVNGNEAKIIRQGKEDIFLSEKKSRIEYRKDGEIVVNDQVVETATVVPTRVPEMNHLIIPYGKTSEVILPDGTKVWLNAGSRLIYPGFFADKTREVFMSGEAFFEVSADKGRPFIVQTSDIQIRVLGTCFNISAYFSDSVIETVLTEGRILLEQNSSRLFSETTELLPGKLAIFNKSERTTQLKEVDVENYTIWKKGLLKFESTELSRVIKKLERYYNVEFKYNNSFLGNIKISGKLELSESREYVFENIADAANVRISSLGANNYEISQ